MVVHDDAVKPVLLHSRFSAEEFEARITSQIVITSSKSSSDDPQKHLDSPQAMQKAILDRVASNEDEAKAQMGSKNWIGMLQEYRQANPRAGIANPVYVEDIICHRRVPRFVMTVTIPERADPFPSPERISFTRKIDAKHYCAYLAVTWLIAHDYMPDDRSVRFPKPKPASVLETSQHDVLDFPKPKPAPSMLFPKSEHGVLQLVDLLCKKLGLSPAKYIIEPASHSLYSGYAFFPQEPQIEGRLGIFENIFGRKNAKETCASGLLQHLRMMELQRAGLEV